MDGAVIYIMVTWDHAPNYINTSSQGYTTRILHIPGLVT